MGQQLKNCYCNEYLMSNSCKLLDVKGLLYRYRKRTTILLVYYLGWIHSWSMLVLSILCKLINNMKQQLKKCCRNEKLLAILVNFWIYEGKGLLCWYRKMKTILVYYWGWIHSLSMLDLCIPCQPNNNMEQQQQQQQHAATTAAMCEFVVA